MDSVRKLPYIIAVDFDGTLCQGDRYPYIGRPNTVIIEWIKAQKEKGAKIILWTCRNKEALEYALKWCKEFNLEFDAVNQNIPEVQEMFGGDTRKVFADIYIDDKNVLLEEIYPYGSRDNYTRKHP